MALHAVQSIAAARNFAGENGLGGRNPSGRSKPSGATPKLSQMLRTSTASRPPRSNPVVGNCSAAAEPHSAIGAIFVREPRRCFPCKRARPPENYAGAKGWGGGESIRAEQNRRGRLPSSFFFSSSSFVSLVSSFFFLPSASISLLSSSFFLSSFLLHLSAFSFSLLSFFFSSSFLLLSCFLLLASFFLLSSFFFLLGAPTTRPDRLK